ncbi:MAG: transglycosylase SLT domain-containing protein [Desulfococcaceae bacterium]|jgi:LysM repeat protein|nr:transglycosylase SLT domain-containing protein [Desulfococcaceae bacterium]
MNHFNRIIIIVICMFGGIFLLCTSTSLAQPLESAKIPSLMSAVRVKGPMDFCGEKVPLQEAEVREDLEKEILLSLWDRAQVILWIKRSGRYMPHIEKMLKQYKMPDDLKYVAIVESALLPHIGSSKGAVGYWQFIPSTGRKYGLRIDKYIDERRNFFTATRAAMSYFRKLYSDFGAWTLAVAAYNMGEHGLARRIDEQKTRDYYHLYLPLETQRYIYKILAVKLILSDLKKYGFHLTKDDIYHPVHFDRVKIDSPLAVPVQSIAEAAGTWFKTIKDMNPEIRGYSLVAGSHYIVIPKGKAAAFQNRLAALMQKEAAAEAARKEIVHVVRRGEFLSGIAEKYNVPVQDLLRWNKLPRNSTIHPGQRLVIKK